MLLFHEIHCDDWFPDRADPRGYTAARELLEQLICVAESHGHRLALRFRHPFAEAALAIEGADNAIVRWEERGHEIGAHAHRRRVRRTARALKAAGVRHLDAVVPGLIQASRRDCLRVLGPCAGLGFRYLTDQPQLGAFAYTGLTPWRPAPDLSGPGDGPWVFIDVSVNPFAWGLLEKRDGQTTHTFGLRDDNFQRLEALLDAQLHAPSPHPVTYFGVPFHEHNHARAFGDLRPDERSLQAFSDHLGRLAARPVTPALPRDVYAAWTAIEGEPAPDPGLSVLRELDEHDLLVDSKSWLIDRLPAPMSLRGPLREPLRAALSPARRLRARLAYERRRRPARRAAAQAHAQPFTFRVGGRDLQATRWGPPDPERVAVICHAGVFGGLTRALRPFGLTPADLPRWAFYAWDRSGTGATRGVTALAPGNPWHVEEAAALWQRAAAEGVPTGWLSFSGGCVAPLLALSQTDPAFLIDGEGPSDRRSLAPNPPEGLLSDPLGAELRHLSKLDDASWSWREPYRLLAGLSAPYHRLQAQRDHAHGESILHARIILGAAAARPHVHAPPTLNGQPWRGSLHALPGLLQDQGPKVSDILMGLFGTGAAR